MTANIPVHQRIAGLGAALEENDRLKFKIDESVHFAAKRRHIRDLLIEVSEGQELNQLVFGLID